MRSLGPGINKGTLAQRVYSGACWDGDTSCWLQVITSKGEEVNALLHWKGFSSTRPLAGKQCDSQFRVRAISGLALFGVRCCHLLMFWFLFCFLNYNYQKKNMFLSQWRKGLLWQTLEALGPSNGQKKINYQTNTWLCLNRPNWAMSGF